MQPKTDPISRLSRLIDKTAEQKNNYTPLFFRLSDPHQKKEFEDLISTHNNLKVYDQIYTQVEELIKCLNPTIALLPPSELTKAVELHFGNQSTNEYGVWVYYPWSERLVHLLDEKEFVIVRTNRNKYKITVKEQAILSQKKIGVMGLSVGHSVSLTLALERGCGELRIADFDELDLSNINRIRTGVYNVKLKKTVIVAREIAEIDPYLKVICYEHGITENNLESFLSEHGNIDLLIDECDSFDIKIDARKRAKELGIPVLMETSDRGTIDIERFDLEPQRPILHGMVDHLDISKYSQLATMDEKLPYLAAVAGVETLSHRMKASAVEIMSTISTWPQLASAVTYGGGIAAEISRKILLGSLNVSGRFFIDIDELISDPLQIEQQDTLASNIIPLQTEELIEFINVNNLTPKNNAYQPSEKTLIELIEAASKAPSGGNNQPWRWHYQKGILHLFLEQSSAQSFLDIDYISSYVSLGGAIENLLLTAASKKIQVNWELTPHLAPKHIAWFSFDENYQPTAQEIQLTQQINSRHTNRKIGIKKDVDIAELNNLSTLTEQIKGARLIWLTDQEKIKALATISVQTDLLRIFTPKAYNDLITREMRWDSNEVNTLQDGIGIHALDLSNNDLIGLRLIKDKKAIEFLHQIDGGGAFKKLTTQQFLSSSAIGLITMPTNAVSALIEGGRAAEKMWLGATAAELQIHPVNVPVIFFYRNNKEKDLYLSSENREMLTNAEKDFRRLFSINEDEQAVFMFRLFKATPSPQRTIRKSVSKIFSTEKS